jgi:biopolymer transport protein ExbD
MKFKKREENEAVGFQVASMIDIVFLLLIFFIVASQMKELEAEKEVKLPVADASATKVADGFKEILINVLPDNRIKVGGNIVETIELAAELRRLAEEDQSSTMKILIRGDQKALYGRIMRIMAACAQANLWNVSFATFQEEEDTGMEGMEGEAAPTAAGTE